MPRCYDSRCNKSCALLLQGLLHTHFITVNEVSLEWFRCYNSRCNKSCALLLQGLLHTHFIAIHEVGLEWSRCYNSRCNKSCALLLQGLLHTHSITINEVGLEWSRCYDSRCNKLCALLLQGLLHTHFITINEVGLEWSRCYDNRCNNSCALSLQGLHPMPNDKHSVEWLATIKLLWRSEDYCLGSCPESLVVHGHALLIRDVNFSSTQWLVPMNAASYALCMPLCMCYSGGLMHCRQADAAACWQCISPPL